MKKLFVPYEIALRLKSIGFGEPCAAYWHNSEYLEIGEVTNQSYLLAPTWDQVLEWIRVNFGVHIADHFNEYDEKYQYIIWVFELNRTLSIDNGKQFDTPQEAIDAALLHVLTKLIP